MKKRFLDVYKRQPLRYMDRYVTVTQGEVMYMTEMLAILEGLERGPAGNTALACAFALARELPEEEIIVVTETEYTGAGKHIQPQLSFARENGIEIRFGDPSSEDIPGKNIILPSDPGLFACKDADLDHMLSLIHILPYCYIWKIIREVLDTGPDASNGQDMAHNGWMAVLFAVIAVLVYIGCLLYTSRCV